MKSPPVSVGSLRGTPPRIRRHHTERVVHYARGTMLATVEQLETAAAARRSLRQQIARLERELAETLASTYPRISAPHPIAHGGPRLLGLEELERTRDALVARVSDTHRLKARQTADQARAKAKLAAMLADPPAHKGER